MNRASPPALLRCLVLPRAASWCLEGRGAGSRRVSSRVVRENSEACSGVTVRRLPASPGGSGLTQRSGLRGGRWGSSHSPSSDHADGSLSSKGDVRIPRLPAIEAVSARCGRQRGRRPRASTQGRTRSRGFPRPRRSARSGRQRCARPRSGARGARDSPRPRRCQNAPDASGDSGPENRPRGSEPRTLRTPAGGPSTSPRLRDEPGAFRDRSRVRTLRTPAAAARPRTDRDGSDPSAGWAQAEPLAGSRLTTGAALRNLRRSPRTGEPW